MSETAIALSAEYARHLKKMMRREFSEVKSSTLSEAIAAGLGFNTHAALLASTYRGPVAAEWNEDRFFARLNELVARSAARSQSQRW